MQSLRYLVAALAALALASMTNVACTAAGELDSGTNESNLSQYANNGYGISSYAVNGYGYFGSDMANDCAYATPSAH